MLNYETIPEHCREGIKRYIENGIIPGDFLQAVISNNLVKAFSLSDHINGNRLKDYAEFLYWEMPMDAWGSRDKMNKWCEHKGLDL